MRSIGRSETLPRSRPHLQETFDEADDREEPEEVAETGMYGLEPRLVCSGKRGGSLGIREISVFQWNLRLGVLNCRGACVNDRLDADFGSRHDAGMLLTRFKRIWSSFV
jgi:hypothetical protein